MRRHTLLFAFVLLLARAPVWAQTNITSTQCASIGISNSSSTVTIQVTGTWTGTLQPQLSIQGQALVNTQVTPSTSTTAQSTITANGVYYANAPAGSPATFYVCGNTVGSGTATVYLNLSSGVSTSTLGGGGAGATGFNTITAGTNTAVLAEGTGGSIAPSGTGQLVGTQDWWSVAQVGPPAGVISNTGGTLNQTHGSCVRLALLSAAGINPLGGGETCSANGSSGVWGSGCASSSCTLAITPPLAACGALPCGGYTGYSVYQCDYSSSACSGSELLVAGCSNITASCSVTAPGAGAAFPSANTAFATASPMGVNLCSPGTNPTVFISDGTSYFPYIGVDSANTAGIPPTPYNKMSICRNVWINDSAQDPPAGRNALLLVNHLQNNTTVASSGQDRGQYILTTNCLPVGNCLDSSNHYALEGLQIQQYINGSPGITGSPDGEISALSVQQTDQTTAATGGNAFGENGIRVSMFRQGNLANNTFWESGVFSQFVNNDSTAATNLLGTAFNGQCTTSTSATNIQCVVLYGRLQGGSNNFQNTVGFGQSFLWLNHDATITPRAGVDWLLMNGNATLASQLNGPVYLTQIYQSSLGTLPVNASVVDTGSITMAQTTITPPASIACSGGASQYTYQFVGVDGNGGQIPSTTAVSPSTCTNPLTGGNPASVVYAPGLTAAEAQNMSQFARIDVYRTGGPMGLGKIGTLTCAFQSPLPNCTAFSDTGIAASGTVPTVNTTGGITTPANATSHLAGNQAYLDANFTTANNTSLQTINGSSHNLVFNLPSNAQVYNFHCALSYSQATGAAAVAFGIQSATVAPNNIFGNGTEQITAGPPATIVTGTLATLASTTATNIVSGTPGAQGVNYTAYLDGTIDNPTNNQGNIINFMVSTATGTDAVTVLKGSYCQLF